MEWQTLVVVLGSLFVIWLAFVLLLWLLLGYLALPFDLVPDLVPVIGYADDAVLVVWTLRSVVRSAGADAIGRHWPGTPDGLVAVQRLAGLTDTP